MILVRFAVQLQPRRRALQIAQRCSVRTFFTLNIILFDIGHRICQTYSNLSFRYLSMLDLNFGAISFFDLMVPRKPTNCLLG